MVAYLSKSNASEGFNQIIDFPNGSFLKLQVLVDRKKVEITEATIREALRLDDAEGVDCLPNEEIFAELARMGYEKPSTKLNLVRNVDSTTKFYMYPHFLQLIIRKQFGNLSTHTTKYASPALTQKEIDEEGDADEHVEEVNTGDAARRDVSTACEDVSAARGDVSTAHGEVPAVTEGPSIPSPTPPTPPPQLPQDIPSTSQSKMLPLCFPIKGIRLISSFPCVRLQSVCILNRPIGKKGCASWDGARAHGEVGLGSLVLFRLISSFPYVRLQSVCILDRPIGKKGCASWDGGKGTWGGRARVFGTVPVYERAGEEVVLLAGKTV
nr:hypothetical protein [Tanacetum cinerariifolium]